MSDQFVAEIRIFPFNFAPTGWAFCNGQLLPISQNTALFSLLGTYYGGNGKSNFALPDLRGNVPMQTGQGPGLSQRDLGQMSGVENVTLLVSEIPAHTHPLRGSQDTAEDRAPSTMAKAAGGPLYAPAANMGSMAAQALPPAGGNVPHNNMQPYLTLHFCIALQGIFPARP